MSSQRNHYIVLIFPLSVLHNIRHKLNHLNSCYYTKANFSNIRGCPENFVTKSRKHKWLETYMKSKLIL